VKKFTRDVAFSGSTVKQGERHALVYATGDCATAAVHWMLRIAPVVFSMAGKLGKMQ
jgi:hypothetical protein